MTVGELRSVLDAAPDAGLHLMLPGGAFVPAHFHVTEVGRVHKDVIDCGGATRAATSCVLQVWVAGDTAHRLTTTRLASILRLAAPVLRSDDLPVEVEFETGVVSQYPLGGCEVTPKGVLFLLGTKHTDCAAPDRCGVGAGGQAGCC